MTTEPMAPEPDRGLTVTRVVEVQRRLRASLGLKEETFPLPAFIGTISDEIEARRRAGLADDEVVALIESVSGRRISRFDLDRWYAPAERREREGSADRPVHTAAARPPA